MAPRYRDINAQDVQSYLDSVQKQANQPAQTTAAEAGAAANNEASRILEERTQEEEAAKARKIREQANQGAVTQTNPITGKRDVVKHADGATKYHPDVVEEARPVAQARTAVDDGQGGSMAAPNTDIMTGGGGMDGAAGASGISTTSIYAETRRDDRGKITEHQITPTIDPKTGRSYVERTDPATGQKAKVLADVDFKQQAKLGRQAEIDLEEQDITMRGHAIERHKQAFNPKWEETDKAYQSTKSDYEKHIEGWQQVGEKWMKTDPKTGQAFNVPPLELAYWKKLKDEKKLALDNHEQQRNTLLPQYQQITNGEKTIAEKKLEIAERKSRLEYDIPEDETVVTKLLGWQRHIEENGIEGADIFGVSKERFDQVKAHAAAGGEMMADGTLATPDQIKAQKEAAATQEAGETTEGAYQPFAAEEEGKLLGGLGGIGAMQGAKVEQFYVSPGVPSQIGSRVLRVNGKPLALIDKYEKGKVPTVTVTSNTHQKEVIDQLRKNGMGTIPVYLQGGGARNPVLEAQQAATIFQAIQDPINYDATGKPTSGMRQLIESTQATPEGIMRRVEKGELSIQVGESLMNKLYDSSLFTTDDPKDEKNFRKWVAETSHKQNEALRERFSNPKLYDKENVGERLKEASTGLKDFSEMDNIKRDYLVESWQKNQGKIGVKRSDYVREHNRLNSKAGVGVGDILGSWVGFAGKTVVNDVAGSMFGLAAGLAAQGGAGMIAMTGDPEAKAKADEFMRLRNKSWSNFTTGFERNLVKWGTPGGRSVMNGHNQALAEFKEVLDEELDKPLAERDQGRIDRAKKSVIFTAKSLHELADDPQWPVTEDDLDPDKDSALGVALARYEATADPRMFEQYKARLLMNKGARQLAGELDKKISNDGFWGAVEGGMYAGWQEIGTELLADASMLVTAGGSKAVQSAPKAAGAVGKAKRIEKIGKTIGTVLDKWETVGIRPESIVTPLTRGQRALNTTVRAGKTMIQAGAGEAGEEMIVEAGADDPNLVHAALVGALGGVALTPVFHPMQQAARAGMERQQQADIQKTNRDFAASYNKQMEGVQGFEPITPEVAGNARAFMAASGYEAKNTEMKQAVAAMMGLDPNAPDYDAKEIEARVAYQKAAMGMTMESEKAIAAAQEIAAMPEESQRVFYSGLAKVASGNVPLLTQAERTAIQGASTAQGAPYFANVNGKEVLTDEARAEIANNAPMVGEIIQTTESVAIQEAARQQAQATAQAQPQAAPSGTATPSQPVESGVQGDPATGGFSVPPHVSDSGLGDPSQQQQPVATELDAGQYESLRQQDPSMPPIQEAVAQAFAAGQPVSVSMANAAGVTAPAGYTQQGSIFAPPTVQNAGQNGQNAGQNIGQNQPQGQNTPVQGQTGNQANTGIPAANAPQPANKTKVGTFDALPKGTVVTSDIYKGEGDIIIHGEGKKGVNGIEYYAEFTGTGRTGIIQARHISKAKTLPTPTPESAKGKAAAPQQIAERVKASIEAALPRLKGKINIINAQMTDGQGNIRPSGGAWADADDGITISIPDIEREIQGNDPAAVEASLRNIILRHEVVHFVQYEAVRQLWDKKGSYDSFFLNFYGKMASELHPDAFAKARDIYGSEAWDAIPSEANKAAELVRMLVEARLNPEKAELFTELSRAINLQQSPTLIQLMKGAVEALIEMVKTGQLPESARAHVEAVAEMYQQLTQEEATAGSAPEAQETSSVSVGKAIGRAIQKHKVLQTKKNLDGLYDLTPDLIELTAEMEPEARAAYIDQAFDEYADGLAQTQQEEAQQEEEQEQGKQDSKAAKARAARMERESRIRDKARKLVNSGNYSAISSILDRGRIQRKPNAIGLILSRKRAGKKLTEKEMQLLRNLSEWDGAPTKSEWKGGGNNEVIRAVIDMLYAQPGKGMMPDEIASGLMAGVDTSSEMFEQLDKELRAISRGENLNNDPRSPDYEGDPEAIAKAEAELAKLEAEEKESGSQPKGEDTPWWMQGEEMEQEAPEAEIRPARSLPEIIADLNEAYGEENDLSVKLSLIEDSIGQLPEAQQALFMQAIEEEGQRIHYGVISAGAWQEQNPNLHPVAAAFQRLIDGATPSSIKGKMGVILSPQGQATIKQAMDSSTSLASSPAQRNLFSGPRTKAKENAADLFDSLPEGSVGRENIANNIARKEGLADPAKFVAQAQKTFDFTQTVTGTKDQPGLFSSPSQPDYKAIDKRFIEDLTLAELGKPTSGRTLELGPSSEALRLAGVPEGRIFMRKETALAKPKQNDHPFPTYFMRLLPAALRDPILVHESWTQPGTMVALLDVKHQGKHFVAALHFKAEKNGTEITEIASFYPREAGKIMGAINRTIDGRPGGITYYHKEKTRDWLASGSGSNSPQSWFQKLGSIKWVATDADIVNREDGGTRLFASPSNPNQGAFDFGATGSFNTRGGQMGFDFSGKPEATVKGATDKDSLTVQPAAQPKSASKAEWVNFPASETLGIPRSEMPQVEAGNRSALVQFLKARGVEYAEAETLPGRLKPTQAEYSPAKVQKAREFKGGDRAILIDRNNRVVDGHHQWLAKLDNPTEPIRVIRFNARVENLLPMIKEMPSTEVSEESGTQTPPQDIAKPANRFETPIAQWKVTGANPIGYPTKQVAGKEANKRGSNWRVQATAWTDGKWYLEEKVTALPDTIRHGSSESVTLDGETIQTIPAGTRSMKEGDYTYFDTDQLRDTPLMVLPVRGMNALYYPVKQFGYPGAARPQLEDIAETFAKREAAEYAKRMAGSGLLQTMVDTDREQSDAIRDVLSPQGGTNQNVPAPEASQPSSTRTEAPVAATIEEITESNPAFVEPIPSTETLTPEKAASELAKRGITITKESTKTGKPVWHITGKTFDVKDKLKEMGARWFNPAKAWTIYNNEDPTQAIAEAIAGNRPAESDSNQPSRTADVDDTRTNRNPDEDLRLRQLRDRLDRSSDERGTRSDALEAVNTSTSELIRRGLNYGMPADVVEDQIEDIAMIRRAFESNKPMFLLGNGAGTGKTFVLGGAIRELRTTGAKDFVYVTMNTDLIAQIKRDLADYGIQDVSFHTYSEMSSKKGVSIPDGAVLIFDEAHNVKNSDSSRGGKAQPMMGRAKFTIFASATPFENPVEAAYLAGTGIFNQAGGHTEWGKAYGANVRKFKVMTPYGMEERETLYWTGGKLEDGLAARQWFVRQGIMVTRPMRLPMEMVDSQFTKRPVTAEYVEIHDKINAAYEDAMSAFRDEDGNILDARNNAMVSMHQTNTIKRVLEAAKVDHAVEEANRILNGGGNVVIFVETKADRFIGKYRASQFFDKSDRLYTYPEIRDEMAHWQVMVGMARMSDEAKPPRPFAEFIVQIARAMHEAGIQYELPSVEDQIVQKLGGKSQVAVYTGSVSSSAATKDKEAFLAGQKRVIVATMAKGGTGLSLHDKVGNRETYQVNLNLPWRATGVDQVSGRVARYGLQSKAHINWLFAENIPFERMLANRVGRRMRDMGALVKGIDMKAARVLTDEFDFQGTTDVKQRDGEVTAPDAEQTIWDLAERLERSRSKASDTSMGFFETPYPLAALMTEVSGARGRLLEPSGGRGNLVRFAKDKVASIRIIEARGDNANYLKGQYGDSVTQADFLDVADDLGQFDTIHMNPPFERIAGVGAQDVAHVIKAYGRLAEGGRLVAIMGEGAFFRNYQQEKDFRAWLDDKGAIVVKLPENAFKNSGTGVRTRMVILDQTSEPGRTDIDLEDMDTDSLQAVAEAIPNRDSISLFSSPSSFKPDETINAELKDMRSRWEAKGIDSFMSARNGDITLSSIRMPKELRGEGRGTAAMKELLDYAAENRQRVLLTPSDDFGATSVARLERFYRGLGFKKNAGRNKDFRTQETMIWRHPDYEKRLMSSPSRRVDREAVRAYLSSNGTPARAVETESERVSSALEQSRSVGLAEDRAAYSQGDLFSPEQPKAQKQGEQIAMAAARAVARAKARPSSDPLAVSPDLIAGMTGNWAALAREINNKGRASAILADLVTREIPVWNVNGTILDNAESVHAVMLPIRSPYFESLKVMVLDGNLKTVHSQILTVGSVNETAAHPADIMGVLARLREVHGKKYNTIIFSHNHPSGNPTPSPADRTVTERINQVAKLAGWAVLDHVITNGERFFSFREAGLMPSTSTSEKAYTPRKKDGVDAPWVRKDQRQAAWEAVPIEKLKDFSTPDSTRELAKFLRNSNPDAAHILYLNTQLSLLAVERVDYAELEDSQSITRRLLNARGREGAHSFIIEYPEKIDRRRFLPFAVTAADLTQMRFIDAVALNQLSGYESAREAGLMEEPRALASSPSRQDNESDHVTSQSLRNLYKSHGADITARYEALVKKHGEPTVVKIAKELGRDYFRMSGMKIIPIIGDLEANQRLMEDYPAESQQEPTQPDLITATTASDAPAKLGDVKVGNMSALGAYRTLTAKRNAGKQLTAKEEQQLLDAETALGQKLAFDMDAVKGEATTAAPTISGAMKPKRAQAEIDTSEGLFGSDNSFKQTKDGQMRLFSSPAAQAFLDKAKADANEWMAKNAPERIRMIEDNPSAFPYGTFLFDVPVSLLKQGNGLFQNTVSQYEARTDAPPVDIDVTKSSMGGDDIEFTVGDGNHRVAAAKNRGDKTIRALVTPWDEQGMQAIREVVEKENPSPRATKAVQQSMFLGQETDRSGQMRLFSSPAQRGVDYSVTKRILEGTYERTEEDRAAARAFQREIRKDDDLLGAIGGRLPRGDSEGLYRESRARRIGAAIISELSGKRLITYTPEVEAASRGVVIPRLKNYVFVSSSSDSIPATVGHEAWHRLYLDQRRDADMIGSLIASSMDAATLEGAEAKYIREYGINGATQEVAANIFSSVLNNAAFWHAYGTPNSEAIALEIEAMGGIPAYPEARLVNDWSSFVKSTAAILRREEAQSLASSPASTPENSAAIDQALEKMPPIYRKVFTAINNGATQEEVSSQFNISERAVENILNQVRSRIVIATKAAEGTLQPIMEEGKYVGNRPDLAEGAKPDFAAIDQIRNESGVPDKVSMEENYREADRRLALDYEGEFNRLEELAKSGGLPSRIDIAIAKTIFKRETFSGGLNDPERRTKVALFRVAYRDDFGTEQGRSLQMRRDDSMSPAERNALSLAELLYEPSPEVQARMKGADEAAKKSILKQWMDKIDAFKKEMKAEGYDIDASIKAFHERKTARKQTEADNQRTQSVLDEVLRKLSPLEKTVVEAIRSGSTASKAMNLTGLPKEEVQRIWTQFVADFRQNLYQSAKRFMETKLASSPGNMISQIEAEFGIFDWEVIDDSVEGFVDKREEIRNPKPQKTKQPKKEKPDTTPDKPLTPAQIAAIERFIKSPPSTWRTLWQTEMKNLRPLFGQLPFDNFNSEYLAPWNTVYQQELGLFPESKGFADWYDKSKAKQRILSGELFPDPINETTGDWNESRPYTGQGELLRDPINETTGTFDMNDPTPMAYIGSEWASRNGSWINKLTEFYKMAILSGPQTMLVNASGGFFLAHETITKRAVEAAWNDILGMFGAGDVRSATLSEFLPILKNVRAAMKMAAKNAIRSWKLQSPVFESYAEAKPIQLDWNGTGAEYAPPALETRTWKQFKANPSLKDVNKLLNGFLRNITFRELTMVDEFWKTMFAHMDVAAIAHRIAAKEEKLSGKAYSDRVEELMQRGSPAWMRAIDRTKRVTFQDSLAYGKFTKEDERRNPAHKAGQPMTWSQALKKSETQSAWTLLDAVAAKAMEARKTPFLGPLMHMFALPFIITPKNLIQRGLEITPLGLVVDVIDGMRSLKRRFHAGQITKEESNRIAKELYNKARFIQTLTNQSLGLIIYFAVESLSDDDEEDPYGRPWITGTLPFSATRKGERDNAAAVMPAQSIRIGDTIIPYGRLEPFATAISALVDMSVSMRRNDKSFNSQVLTDTVVGFKEQMKDKLFLKGLGDLVRVIEDPENGADRLAASWITAFVPNIIRQPVRELDSVVRDKNPQANDGILTAIAKRVGYEIVPYSAPAKLDIWGDPIQAAPGKPFAGSEVADKLFRVFDPLNVRFGSEARPIDAWIYRYNHMQPDSSQRIGIEPPADEITITAPGETKPRKITLTPQEHAESIRRVGQAALEYLGDDWDVKTANDPGAAEKAEFIKETFTKLKAIETKRLKTEKLIELSK